MADEIIAHGAQGDLRPTRPGDPRIRCLTGQRNDPPDLPARFRMSRQIHQRHKTASAVSDPEQSLLLCMLPYGAERRRYVELAETLEVRVDRPNLASPMASQFQDPAVKAVVGEVGRQSRARLGV